MNEAFNIILVHGQTDMYMSFHRTADITIQQFHRLEQPFHTHAKSFLKHTTDFNSTYHHTHCTFVCSISAVTVFF
jgi:hypothetical protein